MDAWGGDMDDKDYFYNTEPHPENDKRYKALFFKEMTKSTYFI